MPQNLVIVESPAKAKTIEKFLGEDYKVMSSYGHIRDLKKKGIGIDIDHGFVPLYEVSEDKEKLVAELKKAVKKAKVVWLASDEDREGEAISWHLFNVLGLTKENTHRIAFHEITQTAIANAIKNPREINMNLVDAQQARRVLDRLVGFEISPILWRKIKPSLSAGRVQSVALRLIVERESEREKFVSESLYRIVGHFLKLDGDKSFLFKAEYSKRVKTEEDAMQLLTQLAASDFIVQDIKVTPHTKTPTPPFTTSTLQQEASRRFGYSVLQTMRLAQSLYEAGMISYMRTDSVNLSDLALNQAKNDILDEYGSDYYQKRTFSSKDKLAQEAHEAIRPTDITRKVVPGNEQAQRLYRLIRMRTIASQMADARLEKTTVTIKPTNSNIPGIFSAVGEVILFDGFLRVYMERSDDEKENNKEQEILPKLSIGEELSQSKIIAEQKFTQPPSRYTEAMLVKKMEELGIGRPSTYAPTISTIIAREYVAKGISEGVDRPYLSLELKDGLIAREEKTGKTGADKNKLVPTDIGTIVSDFLIQFFPLILDYGFTASVEQKMDKIVTGKEDWHHFIKEFYHVLHPMVEEALEFKTERKIGERLLGTDPKTGKEVTAKVGRFGPYIQLGSSSDDEKPSFASLGPGMSLHTITLEEALDLFSFPRKLSSYKDVDIIAAIGRFGPYLKYGNLSVPVPKTIDIHQLTIEEAIQLIEEKEAKERAKVIRAFEEEPELMILNGRYGPYISYQKENYKIPKSCEDPSSLDIDACKKLIEEQNEEKIKKGTKKTSSSKTTKKKAPAKTKKTSTSAKTQSSKSKKEK